MGARLFRSIKKDWLDVEYRFELKKGSELTESEKNSLFMNWLRRQLGLPFILQKTQLKNRAQKERHGSYGG